MKKKTGFGEQPNVTNIEQNKAKHSVWEDLEEQPVADRDTETLRSVVVGCVCKGLDGG